MEITINGVVIDDAFLEEDMTIENALHHVQRSHCGKDNLIIGFHCDGEDVPPHEMAQTLSKPATTYSKIDVHLGTKSSLVCNAMTEAANCLTQTEDECQTTATMLTEGNTVEAAQKLGDCLRIWQQVHEAVGKSIEMLEVDPEQIEVGSSRLSEVITKPKDVLLQMRNALQSQDFVLLADILEYEFSDVTQNWFDIVRVLNDQAKSQAKAEA